MEPMAFMGFGKTTIGGIVKPSVTEWNDIVSQGFACIPHIANIRPSHITHTCHQAIFQQLNAVPWSHFTITRATPTDLRPPMSLMVRQSSCIR